MKNKIYLLAIVMLLLGCSSKETNHHIFNYTPAQTVTYDGTKPLIAIEEIVLPSYIDRAQIVTRDNSTITVSEVEHWAGTLQENIQETLTQTLQKNTPESVFISYPYKEPWSEDKKILVKIIRFDSKIRGETKLVARWSLIDNKSSSVVISETLILSKNSGNSLNTMIETQKDLVVELGTKISHKIKDNLNK